METSAGKLKAWQKSTNERGIIINGSPFDHDEEDDNDGVGRSYECSFCKRGFTNAQALGGHMNIHRKDKLAKSNRQPSNTTSSSSYPCPKPHEEHFYYHDYNNYNNSNYMSTGHPSTCNNLGPQSNYPVFSYNTAAPPVSNFSSRSSSCSLVNYQHGYYNYDTSAHLSLRVGTSREPEDDGDYNEMRNDGNGDALDLELRLGPNP